MFKTYSMGLAGRTLMHKGARIIESFLSNITFLALTNPSIIPRINVIKIEKTKKSKLESEE